MKNEEAIKILKKDIALCRFNPMTGEEEPMNEDCEESAQAMEIAVGCIKMRVPDLPIKNPDDIYGALCPNCRNEVYAHFEHGGIFYCANCGKAIDWDHVEDWRG